MPTRALSFPSVVGGGSLVRSGRPLLGALFAALLFTGCAPSVVRADAGAGAPSAPTAQRAAAPPQAAAPQAAGQLVAARPPRSASTISQRGMASWYGPGFAGRRTANGEIFDPSQLTAAHKELPFNTLVRVTNTRNGKSVVVRINDRGPFKPGRVIDLSRAGAEAIDMIGSGVANVTLELLTLPEGVVRVATSDRLRGFEVISRIHPVGTLLVLTPLVGGEPLVVRVVSQTLPIESPADILVGYELFAAVGSEARLRTD